MSSSNAIDRALTKSELLKVSGHCLATKNGGTMKIYKARHMEWGPVVYKKLEDSVISEDDRLDETVFELNGGLQAAIVSYEVGSKWRTCCRMYEINIFLSAFSTLLVILYF